VNTNSRTAWSMIGSAVSLVLELCAGRYETYTGRYHWGFTENDYIRF
jgi:hypothetical protein